MEYQRISWKSLVISCQDLANKIPAQSIDEIIAIARGGIVFGRLLADYLSIPLSIIGISSYEEVTQAKEPVVTQTTANNYSNKNLLLVDDVSDTGGTFIHGKSYLQNKGAGKVFTASPYIKSHTKFYPDFWNETIDKWIIFPYEIHEIYTLFQRKVGSNKAKELLKGLGIEDWELYE